MPDQAIQDFLQTLAPTSTELHAAIAKQDFNAIVLAPVALPVVSTFVPATGTTILGTQLLSFFVAPVAPATLKRVMVFLDFPTLGFYEVVHDGDAFSLAYPVALGNLRAGSPSAGYTFTVLRSEGWPASPRVVVVAVDNYGNVNAVSSENHAWVKR